MPFLRLAKARLTNTQASYLAEKAIKKQTFEVAIFLTEEFSQLNERYSISVVGRGTVSTIDEIFTELSKYIDGKRTVINCLLDSIADPVEMIRSGLLPHPDIETISLKEEKEEDGYESKFDVPTVVSLLAENVPLEQIEWWIKLENVSDALRQVKLWSFYTKEGAKNEAKRGNSYASLFTYPELLYTKSKRPIIDMSMFRLPRSPQIKKDQIPKLDLTTHYYQPGQKQRLIPVTRYALGMSKSLYFEDHPENDKQFCGTFFYLEEESTTFLRYNTAHVSFSKFTAYQELKQLYYEMVGNDPAEIEEVGKYDQLEKHVSDIAYLNRGYVAYLSGLLHKDLRYTPSQYMGLLKKGLVEYSCFKLVLEETIPEFSDPEVPVYIGSCPNVGLYASEDNLDQPLCILGKVLGIDLIILKYMIGSRQVVAEVLDTRPRDLCFQNLVFAQ